MAERTIVITGATDGMGRASAIELTRLGARLLVVGRSPERCDRLMVECRAQTANPNVDYVVADLSTIEAVVHAGDEIGTRLDRIDTLVNNAGGFFPPKRTLTEDGLEIAFMLQYLSRFVLTGELVHLLRRSDDPLVVTVAGGGSHAKDIDLDDLQFEVGYNRFRSIGRSGALNELLTSMQAERHAGVSFCNYGPGLVRTKTTMGKVPARIFFQTIGRLFTRSPEAAGRDIAQLALGGVETGFYGPGLKRNEPTWTLAHPGMGPELLDRTVALLDGLRGSDRGPGRDESRAASSPALI